MKPGWKSSEFIGMMLSQICTALISMHILTVGQIQSIQQVVCRLLATAIVVATNAQIVLRYLDNRNKLKMGQEPTSNPILKMLAALMLGLTFVMAAEARPILPWRARIHDALEKIEKKDTNTFVPWRQKVTKAIEKLDEQIDVKKLPTAPKKEPPPKLEGRTVYLELEITPIVVPAKE